MSYCAQAFVIFRDKKSLVDAAIEIDQEANIILNYYTDYLRLTRMDGLVSIYRDLKDDFPVFIHLYRRVKKDGLNKQDITTLLKSQQDLKFMERRVELYSEFIIGQQLQKQQLEQEIERLKAITSTMVKINHKYYNKLYKL